MPLRRTDAKAGLEARQPLSREGDLGHQDEAFAPLAQSFGNRLEIHFGLAGSGDPFKKTDGKDSRRNLGGKGLGGGLLFRR